MPKHANQNSLQNPRPHFSLEFQSDWFQNSKSSKPLSFGVGSLIKVGDH
jgi:hypothetical protein